MGKREGFWDRFGGYCEDTFRVAKKLPRETARVADQVIDFADKIMEVTGLEKIAKSMGGGRIGVSTSTGPRGGNNVHYTPPGSSTSLGIGTNSNGAPSFFVGNQAVAPLTTPAADFLHTKPESVINTPAYTPNTTGSSTIIEDLHCTNQNLETSITLNPFFNPSMNQDSYLPFDRQIPVSTNTTVSIANIVATRASSEEVTIVNHDMQSVRDRIAERDKLLRDLKGPGYIPESSLATMGGAAVVSATTQMLNDGVELANAIANVHANTQAVIYSANDCDRAEAFTRINQVVTNVEEAIANVIANPNLIPEFFDERAQTAANEFAIAYESGDLIAAGDAAGQSLYDAATITGMANGTTAFATKTTGILSNTANKLLKPHRFSKPMLFQFEGIGFDSEIRLNSGMLQNSVGDDVVSTRHMQPKYPAMLKN